MTRRILIEILVMVVAGVILGLIGPFGTFAIPAPERIALWVLMVLVGYPFFRGLGVASRWLSAMTHVPHWVGAAAAVMLGAMPLTLVVAMLLSGHSLGEVLQSDRLGQTYLQVLLVSVVVQGGTWLLFQDKREAAAAAVPEETPTAPQPKKPEPAPPPPEPVLLPEEKEQAAVLLQNAEIAAAFSLPAGFGRVIALKGEDHYVRVFGDGGQDELVLMRLRDAIAVLRGVEGLQVHRSWWVTREGTAHIARDGRTATITLATGQEVPVSRDVVPVLKDAGWA